MTDQDIEEQTSSERPLYNIGVVSRMTELSVPTLRAWERRYGFPVSRRTAGGHRLYSERDISQLRWVKAQIDQGMQTSQAIQALRAGYHAERNRVEQGPGPQLIPMEGAATLDVYRRSLWEALNRYDTREADRLLGEALLVHSLDRLIFDVIQPTMAQMGEAWAQDRITVGLEHFATHYLRHRLLMWMLSGPAPHEVQPVVLACAPGEWHEGSLLILGAMLRRRRWPVAYLGQATPLRDLLGLADRIQPSVMVLVAMTEPAAASLLEWPRKPPAGAAGSPVMAFGGRIFVDAPEWQARVPGFYLGDTLPEGLEALERLLVYREGRQ